MGWYDRAYYGGDAAENPFGVTPQLGRRDDALHAHLQSGGSLLTYQRHTPEGDPMQDNVEFLRAREKATRQYAGTINPCADAGEKIKEATIKLADQYKACADELDDLRAGRNDGRALL